MQKKSESWCSWAVSKIKSWICLREHKQTSKHLDMKHLEELLDIGPLEALPENQFNSVIKYLDAKSLWALKYSNNVIKNKIDKLNQDTKDYDIKKMFLKENYEKNLLRCAYIAYMCACDSGGTDDLAKQLVDYKTGETFGCLKIGDLTFEDSWNIDDDLLRRTLQDFAERFIRPKDATKCNCFIEQLSTWYSWDCSGASQKFVEDMFAAAGFTTSEIWYKADMNDVYDKSVDMDRRQEKLGDRYNESIEKTKKQIKNYQNITGKSYKSIYNHLKSNPNLEKPEMENYTNAYEELKKGEGGCNIF